MPGLDAPPAVAEEAPLAAQRAPRRRLSPMAAFTGMSVTFAALFFAAGAPTPLLVHYQHEWDLPAGLLTVAFAVYTLALLAALLVGGSLSDHIGRRPVLIGSLLIETVAMAVFIVAPGIGWIICARVIQGAATGMATSAFTASVVELAPPGRERLGSVIAGTAAAGGLGLGALVTGAVIQLTGAANTIVFAALAVIMVAGAAVAARSPETAPLRPGAAQSLLPRVSVPPAARREFTAAVPVLLAAWMLGGLFMGLAPTIVLDIFHVHSGFADGATASIYPLAGSTAGFALGRLPARRAMVAGSAAVLVAAALIVGAVGLRALPLLLVGGVIGGAGFGGSFSGAIRLVSPLVEQHHRARTFAALYVVAYLAFGVPVLIAGQLIAPFGLLPTVIGYGALILAGAAAGLAAQRLAARRLTHLTTAGPALREGRTS
jgi:MFS family permease